MKPTHSLLLSVALFSSSCSEEDTASKNPRTLQAQACAKNYLLVSGEPSFCVSKLEMKCAEDETGQNCGNEALPKATFKNQPWVNISRDDAKKACSRLGKGYSLINNSQWMTIARAIEINEKNWVEKEEGAKRIKKYYRGHSDAVPDEALPAFEGSPYHLTESPKENDTGWEQRRTLFINETEEIWDFAGNVWEWLADDYTDLGIEEPLGTPIDINDVNKKYTFEFDKLAENNVDKIGPLNREFNKKNNVGYAVINGVGNTVLRGGYWNNGDNSGIYRIDIQYHKSPNDTQQEQKYDGFRCVHELFKK